MVRISDILRRGRDEENKKRKSGTKTPQQKKIPKGQDLEIKKSPPAPAEKIKTPKVKGINKRSSKKTSHIEIARVVMQKTRAGRPKSEEIYKELISFFEKIYRDVENKKPIEGKEIAQEIEKTVEQMVLAGDELIGLIGSFSEGNYLIAHCVNVTLLCIKVGIGLGYNKVRLHELGICALLYDIGMINILDLASLPRSLNKEEYELIEQHPYYGVEILKKAKDIPKAVIFAAHQHHERIDALGYPRKLKSEELIENARLIAIADVYEALTHPRSYRRAMLPFDAVRELVRHKKKFDSRLLKALIDEIGIYPVGSWVQLNTGEIGKVKRINRGFPLQPTVAVLTDSYGRTVKDTKSVELNGQATLFVKRPLDESEIEARFASMK